MRQEQNGYANLVLDSELKACKPPLSPRDAAFASGIFYTVLERRSLLDWMLAQFSKRPLEKLEMCIRDRFFQICTQRFNFFARDIIGDTDRKLPQSVGPVSNILDVFATHLGVFYRNHCMVRRADTGGAERDIFHRALIAAQNHIVTNAKGMFQHQRYPCNQV